MFRLPVCAVAVLLAVHLTARADYEAYPPGGTYVTGTAATYAWGGENFESYANNAVVEASTNMTMRTHLDVTSGTLYGKHVTGSSTYKRGWNTTYDFRVVANGFDGSGAKVKWTDASNEYRANVNAWHAQDQNGDPIPVWSGLHAFARYQNNNNLYVASLRYDGQVTIKRKVNGTYATLADGDIASSYLDAAGHLKTGQWFTLKFSVFGSDLKFYIDGTLVLIASDSSLAYGTIGIRTDYANVYLDDWKLLPSNPEPASALLLGVPCGLALLVRRRA